MDWQKGAAFGVRLYIFLSSPKAKTEKQVYKSTIFLSVPDKLYGDKPITQIYVYREATVLSF